MGLTKMTIGKFEVQVNPETINYDRSINYNKDDVTGANRASAKFKNYGDEKISFDLTFDGTGVIPPKNFDPAKSAETYAKGTIGSSEAPDDIIKYLEEFEKIIFNFNGKEHGPNKVEIKWGSLHIKNCYIADYKIAFKLFSPDGKPIRAVVNLAFQCIMGQIQRAKEANKSSPDLTHVKTIRMGDELFLMCQEVYKSPKYYLQVAEKNNILNFRKLKQGDKLLFPPLKS